MKSERTDVKNSTYSSIPIIIPYKQLVSSGKVNGAVLKRPRPIIYEMDSDVVDCPIEVNKYWMF